jgi:hypothetical protein
VDGLPESVLASRKRTVEEPSTFAYADCAAGPAVAGRACGEYGLSWIAGREPSVRVGACIGRPTAFAWLPMSGCNSLGGAGEAAALVLAAVGISASAGAHQPIRPPATARPLHRRAGPALAAVLLGVTPTFLTGSLVPVPGLPQCRGRPGVCLRR